MKNTEAILVFMKNPVLGKVKTRLAADLGEEKVLEIYKFLLTKTFEELAKLPQEKLIFYSDFIPEEDPGFLFYQRLQNGIDLGEKMKNAFDEAFSLNYDKLLIIGTDCPGLNAEILQQAFISLNQTDAVIGPAADGGYYLLGMKKRMPQLFENMEWSTFSVFSKTIEILEMNNYSFSLLPVLYDIDEAKDWFKFISENPYHEFP